MRYMIIIGDSGTVFRRIVFNAKIFAAGNRRIRSLYLLSACMLIVKDCHLIIDCGVDGAFHDAVFRHPFGEGDIRGFSGFQEENVVICDRRAGNGKLMQEPDRSRRVLVENIIIRVFFRTLFAFRVIGILEAVFRPVFLVPNLIRELRED